MNTRTASQEVTRARRRHSRAAIAKHLLCFASPLVTLAYLYTGPLPWYLLPLWAIPFTTVILTDAANFPTLTRKPGVEPRWPFEIMLYLLAGLQFANIYMLCVMTASAGWSAAATWVTVIMASGSSGWSGIVVAHEFLHRGGKFEKLLGRALLVTVLYEHFFTEHLRGHHRRVATAADPATARFGETFSHFWRRTIPAQFRSAWRLECKRLGDTDMRLTDPRQLGNRVLHGLAVELALVAAIAMFFGPVALTIFLLQALGAVTLLEAVNYLEHWGLTRQGEQPSAADAWDSESWVTRYALVGLARHADHHMIGRRPFHGLQHHDTSPKLPYGYNAMITLAMFRNRRFREMMTERLRHYRLGPFRT